MSKEENDIIECITELRKCKEDPIYFYSNYLMVKDKNGKMVVPKKLNEFEKQFIKDVFNKNLINKI